MTHLVRPIFEARTIWRVFPLLQSAPGRCSRPRPADWRPPRPEDSGFLFLPIFWGWSMASSLWTFLWVILFLRTATCFLRCHLGFWNCNKNYIMKLGKITRVIFISFKAPVCYCYSYTIFNVWTLISDDGNDPYTCFFKSGPFPASFYLFSSFQYSW